MSCIFWATLTYLNPCLWFQACFHWFEFKSFHLFENCMIWNKVRKKKCQYDRSNKNVIGPISLQFVWFGRKLEGEMSTAQVPGPLPKPKVSSFGSFTRRMVSFPFGAHAIRYVLICMISDRYFRSYCWIFPFFMWWFCFRFSSDRYCSSLLPPSPSSYLYRLSVCGPVAKFPPQISKKFLQRF